MMIIVDLSEVYFVRDLKEDLQRRDFTINAIAMDKILIFMTILKVM